MSDSRQEILRAIRQKAPPASELPSPDVPAVTYPDPQQQFIEMLNGVGGQAVVVADREALLTELQSQPVYRSSEKIVSVVPGLSRANVDLNSIDDPHQLEDLDLAVLSGSLAVAENGAVWVTDRGLKHRVIYFIAQHVILVVPLSGLVHNMHQAYARLTAMPEGLWDGAQSHRGFGVFVSGPSKTADIEQSLVIGAHGARSLTVMLIRSE